MFGEYPPDFFLWNLAAFILVKLFEDVLQVDLGLD